MVGAKVQGLLVVIIAIILIVIIAIRLIVIIATEIGRRAVGAKVKGYAIVLDQPEELIIIIIIVMIIIITIIVIIIVISIICMYINTCLYVYMYVCR